MGVLHWSPETTWAATFFEFTLAMKAHLASKGVKAEDGMTRDEFLSLKAQDEQGRKAG